MYQIDPAIIFLIVVPDWRPEDATPFQGFSLSLCSNSWMVRHVSLMPTSVLDLTKNGLKTLLARRMSGSSPVRWYGQSPRAVRSAMAPPFLPFALYMLPESEAAADYKSWSDSCPMRPTLVAHKGGDLGYQDLSVERLQKHFLSVLERMPDTVDPASIQEHRDIISSWEIPTKRQLGYKVGGHNSVIPNLAALSAAGYQDMTYGPFKDIQKGPQPLIDQIVLTATSILDERDRADDFDLQRIYRPTPDVNLFAPAIYPHIFDAAFAQAAPPEERKRLVIVWRALEGQTGYSYEARTPAQSEALFGFNPQNRVKGEEPKPHPLMKLRASELSLNTEVMSCLAVSEFSVVLRMPNDVNRTSGTARNFAELYRSNAPTSRKRLLGFRQVQERLKRAVPTEFVDIIRRSKSGVRVVSDAHLEWLDVDGLPLMLRKACSRIPVTPGNLFVEQSAGCTLIHLSPTDFGKILVISALAPGDPIAGLFKTAFDTFEPRWRGKLELETVSVANAKELVDAINGFDGALIVFDGHGSHQDGQAAHLHLQKESVDVWTLRDQIKKIAPIVLLSACDTHAADRNHATAANGFLSLGARTVIGSVFPLEAQEAAVFTARFLYRMADFLRPAINIFDQGLRWTDVVTGMLRMQALTNFLRIAEARNIIDDQQYRDVHVKGNMAINCGDPDPFGVVIGELEKLGCDRKLMQGILEVAVANSSVISYLQLGRPETILIDDPDRVRKQMEEIVTQE